MARFPTARPQRTGPLQTGRVPAAVRPGQADRRRFLQGLAAVAAGCGGVGSRPALAGETVQLVSFELQRSAAGLRLDFQTRFELPRSVEDALIRGVPLNFEAQASVYRRRWYWRDARVARATRSWRLAWQPLTRTYRVSFGALHQTFESLPEAMSALRGAVGWQIGDAEQIEDGSSYYVEFSYRLDTDELPRPMQIGLAGQSDWLLAIEHSEALP